MSLSIWYEVSCHTPDSRTSDDLSLAGSPFSAAHKLSRREGGSDRVMSGIMQSTTVVVHFVLSAYRTTDRRQEIPVKKTPAWWGVGSVDALEFATKVLERLEAVWTVFASSVCGV